MNLTSTEIFKLVWDRIRDSLLGKTVPMMYADHYPNNPSGEFIVVGSLSNVVGDSQVATVNVNIYYGHEIEMYTVEQGEKRDKRQ